MGKFGGNSGCSPGIFAFDGFCLDTRTGELRKGDREFRLTPRAAAVLALLAERSQAIVSKQEFFARVWDGKATGDEALTSCIRELRLVFGDHSRSPRYIETRHRRGYRLMVPARLESGEPVASAIARPSVMIMPFRDLNGAPKRDALADGLAEDIATALSRCTDLAVIAPGEIAERAGNGMEPAALARQLGARYLLVGSARRSDGRARVSVRLVDAASGEQLWAEKYDRKLGDLLLLGDDISSRIVASFAPRVLRAEEHRVRRLPPNSLRAYELALLSQAMSCQGDAASNEVVTTRHHEALRLARRSLALDPDSPFAWAALALAYVCLPEDQYFDPDQADVLDKAVEAAEELRRRDPSSYVAFYVAGKVCIRRKQGREALASLLRAHELNPNNSDVLRALAWAEHNLGLGAEAREHLLLALRLNPQDVRRFQFYWGLAWAEFVLQRPAAGAAWARKAIEDAPTFYPAHTILAACLVELGDLQHARELVNMVWQQRRGYLLSRLEGKNFFSIAGPGERYTSALRRAASWSQMGGGTCGSTGSCKAV